MGRPPIPCPSYSTLLVRMRRCARHLHPWRGIVYRSVEPGYANSGDLLSGEGSRRNGGRWNPKGSFPTVYGSLDLETALAEALAHARYYGLSDAYILPRMFVAMRVSLRRVLDLRDAAVRRRLCLGLRRIRTVDWRRIQNVGREAVTQALGRAAHEAGIEGLLVPSSPRRSGVNLAWFPGNLSTRSGARIRRERRLRGR